jgi:hypothetical protein
MQSQAHLTSGASARSAPVSKSRGFKLEPDTQIRRQSERSTFTVCGGRSLGHRGPTRSLIFSQSPRTSGSIWSSKRSLRKQNKKKCLIVPVAHHSSSLAFQSRRLPYFRRLSPSLTFKQFRRNNDFVSHSFRLYRRLSSNASF